MPGENGGDLGGFLGEMLMGGLEAMASQREGRGERREGRPAGLEALEQIAARQMPGMQEYFKSGAPYGPTQEGMMRWMSERAAAATKAAAERLAEVAAPAKQVAHRAQHNVMESAPIRSFAEGDHIRSFAEHERIVGVGE
ncbi:MAG TPA: hypothetical protein VKT82_03730 [Ktedonobacterales bacterium]|nr:hypothetical protein [Ktedonobacterales bacterium]